MPWQPRAPMLQFTEFSAWSDVSRLFAPHYESADIPEGLASEIDQLAEQFPDPADRAVEWLRFVQRELRYFALSFGEGGLVPPGIGGLRRAHLDDLRQRAAGFPGGVRPVQPLHRTAAIEREELLARSDLPRTGRPVGGAETGPFRMGIAAFG